MSHTKRKAINTSLSAKHVQHILSRKSDVPLHY
jgi:hypothetical protein